MPNRHVQWAAQFAAASALCRIGYDVTFTMGQNTDEADLFVRSPNGNFFSVDVKGLQREGNWRNVHPRAAENHYLICVVVGEVPQSPHSVKDAVFETSFFVAKHESVADKVKLGNYLLPTTMRPYLENWGCLPE